MIEDNQVYLVTGLQYGYKPEVHVLAILTHSHQRAIEQFRKKYHGAEIYSCTTLAEAREVVKILEAVKEGRQVDSDLLADVIDDMENDSAPLA
ncbi:hypothetical protein SKTS_17020 [Sulfurimicrobium lacus]|uniref:Uncharacterized protein n=1 Tax=Sulfurimicrobium lacus TaxID=2715678 RepID=A0A6F8VCS6_9PROT|nr:hypothetical protein [Sulfurimicrobium lacus]BCB26816.1 hypothetical protein SKTS_17020 [Sulfurimicrobium lacus]